ncbi:MAG: helix-turn-helix domain-containing protein [Pseudomonadota bacterium]
MSGREETPQDEGVERLKSFDDYDVRLGDLMRGERATLGKSLLDVQRDLKIKATYIAAIENTDPTAFESPGFIAGYVRSYARYLGMDPEWAYRAFCDEGNFTPHSSMAEPAKAKAKAKAAAKRGAGAEGPTTARDPLASPSVAYLPNETAPLARIEAGAIGSVAVLAALVAGIGYGGWAVLQEVQKVQFTPVEETPIVLSDLDPLDAAVLPETAPEEGVAVAGANEGFDRLYRPQALEVPVLTARDGPIATIEPGSLGALAPDAFDTRNVAEAVPIFVPEPVETAELIGPLLPDDAGNAAAPVQVVADGPPEVQLVAVRPSWVRLRAADGTILFEKILDAGERYLLPATEEPPVLRAGNAGSLYFMVGDTAYGPAGQGASVIRDVVVSAEAVTGEYAVADMASDDDLARFVAVAEAQE